MPNLNDLEKQEVRNAYQMSRQWALQSRCKDAIAAIQSVKQMCDEIWGEDFELPAYNDMRLIFEWLSQTELKSQSKGKRK